MTAPSSDCSSSFFRNCEVSYMWMYEAGVCNMSQFCTIRNAPQPSSSDVVCLISKMAAVGDGGGRLI
jgi:hypothetical protein